MTTNSKHTVSCHSLGIVLVPSAPFRKAQAGGPCQPSVVGMMDRWLRRAGTSTSPSLPIFSFTEALKQLSSGHHLACIWLMCDPGSGPSLFEGSQKQAGSSTPTLLFPKRPLLLLSFFPESYNWLRSRLSGQRSPWGGQMTWREGRASSGFFSEHSCFTSVIIIF